MASSNRTPTGIAGTDTSRGGWASKHVGQALNSVGQHTWLGVQIARSTTAGLKALIDVLAKPMQLLSSSSNVEENIKSDTKHKSQPTCV